MNSSNFNMAGMGMGMQQPDPQIQLQDRQNNQQIQRHVLQLLQGHKVPAGWQQSVQIQDRAMKIYQLISSLRLIQPRIEIHHAIGVATGFEGKAFDNALDKASYERECQDKLTRIRDTRAKQAAAMQQAQNNQNMQPGMVQQMQQMTPNMTPNMGVPQGHPAMGGQNMNPNFRGNMDHILGQQQDGLRAQEAGSLVVPASNVPPQRMNAQQFPNMLQQQGANRGPVMNPGLAAQQQQQWNNAQQTQHEKMQSVHLQAQAQAQAQARLNMQARAAQQTGITAGAGVNPQQIPVSQSPAMPMLNRPMNQMPQPQPQGTPQPRPQSRMPQFDGAQQSGPQMQQRMVQNPMAMQRPPMPDWVPQHFREQLARMPDDQYRVMLHRMAQQHQTNIHRRQQALAQQQAQQQQGGQPQQQGMRQQLPNQQPQFNSQLQHPMQPTPLPNSQPQQPQQPPAVSNQATQQRGDASLTEEENAQVNIMASEMAKTTPKAEMDKIRANLQNIAQEHKESLAKRGLDPLAFFFRSQALSRFKRSRAEIVRRQQVTAQNAGADPVGMPQQQRHMPQALPMQMQGSQGQHPATQGPPLVGQPGQIMPGQQQSRGPNGQPQPAQIPQNRAPQQPGQGPPQQPQRPQGAPGQQGLLRVPNDLTRGQPQNGPAMTDQQISTMDKMPFPNGIINPQNSGGSQLPKTVKTWGQLKQWATTQQGDQQGVTLQKLLTLQRLHFMQTMAQNKPNQASFPQLNVQMAGRPAQPGAGPPASGHVQPMQLQNSQQDNQPRPVPMQSGIPEGWQPSIQEIQRARISLPKHAQAWTDEMVRQFLFRAREHKMKELQRQQQMAQLSQQAHGQTQAPAPAPQPMPASIASQSRPQPQFGQRPGPPNAVAQQGPRGRGTPLPQQPPQQPPTRQIPKRANSDEVMEIPNPNQPPPRPQPQQGSLGQLAPMNAPQPRQLPQLTREQYVNLPPDQQARYDALRQQAAARGQPLPGMAPNDPEAQRINMRLKALMNEEGQKLALHPPPPVIMSPEQRQMMIQRLPQARDMLSRIDTAMRVGLKLGDDENQIRQIIIKRILLYQQFRINDQKLGTAPPAEHFTMTIEDFELTIMILRQYFTRVMAQVHPTAKGVPQQPPVKSQPPEQMVLTAQNLQEFEKQNQIAQQKARQTEVQQQKQGNNDSRAPPAPTSAAPPFALGPHSPQGIPRAYGETNALTQDKLKLPPAKKPRKPPNNAVSAGSTPAHVQGTPVAQSPQPSKPPSPEFKKQTAHTFKCPVGGCEFSVKGFATQQEVAKHGIEVHRPKEKPIEKPVEFALDSIRKSLGLDENGKMKTPKPDLQKTGGLATKSEDSRQGLTPKPKEEKSSAAGTPLNRPTNQVGKSASPAALKDPQFSSSKPLPSDSKVRNMADDAQRLSQTLEIQFGKVWEDSSVSPMALSDAFVFVDPPKDFSAGLGSDWGFDSWQHVKYSSMLDTSSSSGDDHSPPKVGDDSPKQRGRGTDMSKVVNLADLDLSVTPDPVFEKMDLDIHASKKSSLDDSWDNASMGSYDPLDDTWFQELKGKNGEARGTKRKSEDRDLAPEEMYAIDWDVDMDVQDDGLLESEAWKEWFGNN